MHERTVDQTHVCIDGSRFVLSPSQDVDALCEQLEAAVAGAGLVVRFSTMEGRQVRALITPRSRVLINDESVMYESDDAVLSLGASGNWDLL